MTNLEIKTGSKVQWTSSAGVLQGVIESIELRYNAAGELCPWIMLTSVKLVGEDKLYGNGRQFLNANHSYMVMMRFIVDGQKVVTRKVN